MAGPRLLTLPSQPRNQQQQNLQQGLAPERNLFEMQGRPIPAWGTPEGDKLRNTGAYVPGGAGSLEGQN